MTKSTKAGSESYKSLECLSDEELFACAATGDQDALTILFHRFQYLVFEVAHRIVRDPGGAEDVAQNVFLDIYRARANFDPRKGILKVWILQYAYHRALHRKRHLTSNHFYKWENLEAAIGLGAERGLWGGLPETVILAEQMLEKLKPHQREVIEMTYYEGLTAEEIARRLGTTPCAVRHHLTRGIEAMRRVSGKANEKP
jgi:RNA polymerase sigma-70 factor, ECF subfamily